MDESERLTASEALILAGLLRQLIRADGHFTDPERLALAHVSNQVIVTESPSATGDGASPLGEDALYAKIDEAAQAYASEDALRKAAFTVTRPEARAAIHALLFEVAASDTISVGEARVLDWLAEIWELETPRDLEGEKTDVG